MDPLSHSLHTYLVALAYQGGTDDEEALLHYYGLFGHERLALADIARERQESPEQTMAVIDRCIRKLAVTPEWQMINRNDK